MEGLKSISHCVYMSADIVVKIIDVDHHSRLDRAIALAPHLPIGLTSPLLASGFYQLGGRDLRYASYARMAVSTPRMGMSGVDPVTARLLAEQAVRWLNELHGWTPADAAEQTLREPLDHGGFVGRAELIAQVEHFAALNRERIVPHKLLDGLAAIAERAPSRARAVVPVHADCHWGNWLAHDQSVTALLDFEWARFGELADDWFFLTRFSGPHKETTLNAIVQATATPSDTLRAECGVSRSRPPHPRPLQRT